MINTSLASTTQRATRCSGASMSHTRRMAGRSFTAEVLKPDEGPGHAIAVPFDVHSEFGAARPRVRVTLDDHAPFTTTVAAYSGRGWIGLRKAQLAEFGLAAGDTVRVTLDLA